MAVPVMPYKSFPSFLVHPNSLFPFCQSRLEYPNPSTAPIFTAMKLGLLKRNAEELKLLAERQEPRLRFYESRAQNITMGYLIWERLFFFALSQTSSSLKCVDWRMVLGLSLSCSFVYFLLFLEAVTMLYRTQNQMDMICKEQTDICQQILDAGNQDDAGSAMEAGDFSDGVAFNFSFHVRTTLNYDYSFRIVERKVYICAIVWALVAVTAFELHACKYLLCH